VLLANPIAWVDRILTSKWTALASHVGNDMMPVPISAAGKSKRKRFQEYGCGSYGCVLPTAKPGIVFKLTTDSTEAAFINYVVRHKLESDGLVRYFKVLAIPGSTHQKRPIFAIWREEAQAVGEINRVMHHSYGQMVGRLSDQQEFARLIQRAVIHFKRGQGYHEDSRYIIKLIDDWSDWAYSQELPTSPYRIEDLPATQRIALAVVNYKYNAEVMSSTKHVYLLGDAFLTYMKQNLFLADVHSGNIGIPIDTSQHGPSEPIIIDPGHAFALDDRLEREPVDVL
jgi:hypothetical protein